VKPRGLRVQPEGSLFSLALCVVTRVSRVSESVHVGHGVWKCQQECFGSSDSLGV